MNDALLGATIGAIPSLFSAYLLYRQSDRAGKREKDAANERAEFDLRREQAGREAQALATAADQKRAAYAAFLHAALDAKTALAQGVAEDPVFYTLPADLVGNLSRGASLAMLEAHDALAEEIHKIQIKLMKATVHAQADGGLLDLPSDDEIDGVRGMMRMDLTQ